MNPEEKRWLETVARVSAAIKKDVLPGLADLAYGSRNFCLIDKLTPTAIEYLSHFALPKEYFKLLKGKMQLHYVQQWQETLFLNDMLGMIMAGKTLAQVLEESEEMETPVDEALKTELQSENDEEEDDESEFSELSEDSALLDLMDKFSHYNDNCREFAFRQFKLRNIDVGEAIFEVTTKGAYLGKHLQEAFEGQTSHVLWAGLDGVVRPTAVSDIYPLRGWLSDEPLQRINAWNLLEQGDQPVRDDESPNPVTPSQSVERDDREKTEIWHNTQPIQDEE